MAKPIFLIRLPRNVDKDNMTEIQKRLDAKLYDWHVLMVQDVGVEIVEFTSFKDDEAQDINIEELKEMLLKQIA